MPATALCSDAVALGGPLGSSPERSADHGRGEASADVAHLHGRFGTCVHARLDFNLPAAGYQDAAGRQRLVPAHARAHLQAMIGGKRCRLACRGAAIAALLTLLGCSHVSSEPTRGIPPRGKQEGPLPGVPEEQPWVEANVPPPPYPSDADLTEFFLSGQTDHRYFIDTSSLTVGADRVVRFALVIRTAQGTDNASFSALRCSERAWKDYAYGRGDHTWSVRETPQWQRIQNINFNNYQATLYLNYLCVGGVSSVAPAGDAAKLVRLLKHPVPRDDRNPTMPKL